MKVIRSANRATLILDDGKYKSEGRAKGENVKINLDSNNVFFGAGVLSQGSVGEYFSEPSIFTPFVKQLLGTEPFKD